MRLGEVLNKIFRKKEVEELVTREPAEDIYKSIEHQPAEESRFDEVSGRIIAEQGEKEKTEEEVVNMRNKYIIISAIAVAAIVIVALIGILFSRVVNSAFKESDVTIAITGPADVSVGEDAEYTVVIENNNRVALSDATVDISMSENLTLLNEAFISSRNMTGAKIDVGDVKSHGKKEYKIRVQVGYSDKRDLSLKAFIKYQPSNVNSYFQSNTSRGLYLKQSTVNVLISTAESISSGEKVEFNLVINNDGNYDYKDIILNVEYPKGFEFEKSFTKSIGENNNQWKIENLQAGESESIRIVGVLAGSVDSVKKLKVSITKDQSGKGVLFTGEKVINIVPEKVILRQEVDDKSVYPGERIMYTVYFKNNSTVPLRNLILKTYLPGKYIQNDEVGAYEGYYNSSENLIIWKAADVEMLKELQPGEEGKVVFEVTVDKSILLSNGKNKNPYLRLFSEIESMDVDSPIFENKKITSAKNKTLINSVSGVISKISYLPGDNDGEEIEYLRVNKKAILRVQLAVNNTTNNIKDVKFTANLPSGISWERQIYPEGDNLDFNKRTNQLEWNMGVVDAGTGFESPAEKAEFLISITPSVNQVNEELEIMTGIKIEAEDIFTDNDLSREFNSIKSGLIDGLRGGAIMAEE